MFGQVYRIRLGPDYSMKNLDWIRIAKIPDLSTLQGSSYRSAWHEVARIKRMKWLE